MSPTSQIEPKPDFDIIIVGGGMVGASLARLLKDSQLRILLLDRVPFDEAKVPLKQEGSPFDPRVSAITKASRELFTGLGIWSEIEGRRCCNYQDMLVWDADGTGSIQFCAEDLNQSELGTIVENSIILSALYDALPEQKNLRIEAPASVESFERDSSNSLESLIHVRCDTSQCFSTKLLIAADGANSKIRELAEFETSEWDYDHQAIVSTVRTKRPHKGMALQRFMSSGPLAFLPLEDQHHCSIVWSTVPERAEELMALSEAEFNAELGRNIEHKLGVIESSDQRFSFPLRQRHAKNYFQDNLVLVGDAAHTIHPLAGQGVNLGLLDVGALAEELQRGVAAGRSPADPVILQRYQRRRIANNLGMMYLMEGFKYLFAEEALPLRWIRNIGLKELDRLPVIKHQLARKAMGL